MELRQIRYFEAIARHMHFTRAAEELYVAQPALSAQVRRLETELGVQLFARTSRSVHLTDAGSAFLSAARKVLADVSEAYDRLRDVAEMRTGNVAIGVQQSLNAGGTLPPLLARFRQEYPGIDLVLSEENTPRGLTKLADGDLDLGLFCVDGYDETPGLFVEPLIVESIVLVAGQERMFDGDVSLSSLRYEPFIAFLETAMLRKQLTQLCSSAGFVPRIACESDASGSIRALASAGLGLALLPLPTVRAPGPPVRVVPLDFRPQRTISLVMPIGRYQSTAARGLVELLRGQFTAEEASAGT